MPACEVICSVCNPPAGCTWYIFCRRAQSVSVLQAGKGSATLSMAYAAAVFAESCLKAMAGQSGPSPLCSEGLARSTGFR